jgi:drug/metabolite transporter (DMT)-like permease
MQYYLGQNITVKRGVLLKFLVIGAIIIGASVFSLLPILSAYFFQPTLKDSIRFNIYFLPLSFIGNIVLAWGFIQGNKIFGNTVMLGGIQTGVNAILITILSILVLRQSISVYSIIGIFLIAIGAILLNK